jgi:hypothetical protein
MQQGQLNVSAAAQRVQTRRYTPNPSLHLYQHEDEPSAKQAKVGWVKVYDCASEPRIAPFCSLGSDQLSVLVIWHRAVLTSRLRKYLVIRCLCTKTFHKPAEGYKHVTSLLYRQERCHVPQKPPRRPHHRGSPLLYTDVTTSTCARARRTFNRLLTN